MAEIIAGPSLELPAPGIAASPSRVRAHTWSLARRVGFRWLFSYVLLFALPFPLDAMPWTDALQERYAKLWEVIVKWTGLHLFGLGITVVPNGSGDTTFNYVQLVCFAAIASAATLVWSVLDRRRADYARLDDWLRAYVRLYLAVVLCSYGAVKVIQSQFPAPSLGRLVQSYGTSSPMGLLWTFMGASPAYNVFAGASEMFGGLLLVARRTTLFGALVSMTVLSNVVMLNFCYDVPVKIFSLHLLAFAVLLAAPDMGRLLDFFVRNRPVTPAPPRPLLGTPWAHRAAVVGRTLAMLAITVLLLVQARQSTRAYGDLAPKPALYGIWSVDQQAIDGAPRAPLMGDAQRWKRVVVDRGRWTVLSMNDTVDRYFTQVEKPGSIQLGRRGEATWRADVRWTRPAPDRLLLDTTFDGHRIHAELHRLPEQQFLLTSRGFHWVNEYPFNR